MKQPDPLTEHPAGLNIHPITLTGSLVRLEPLSLEHLPGLCAVALDPAIWRYMVYGDIHTPADLRAWISDLLGRQARGTDLPFTVFYLPGDKPVGCTRYMNIAPQHRGLEIGGTWYGMDYQRTGVNTETKYLLLRHAFETLGAIRVQIKTDLLNERSQRAIERIGAVKEGVLRDHVILPDGRVRSSVMYSILAAEWPAVKARLEDLMRR